MSYWVRYHPHHPLSRVFSLKYLPLPFLALFFSISLVSAWIDIFFLLENNVGKSRRARILPYAYPYTQHLEHLAYKTHGGLNKYMDGQINSYLIGHHRDPFCRRREVLHQSTGEGTCPWGEHCDQAKHLFRTGRYQHTQRWTLKTPPSSRTGS